MTQDKGGTCPAVHKSMCCVCHVKMLLVLHCDDTAARAADKRRKDIHHPLKQDKLAIKYCLFLIIIIIIIIALFPT